MEIPECLVGDILIRLPIKSVVRFRTACKSWYAILSNTEFLYTNLTAIDSGDQLLYKHHRNWDDEVFSLISFNSPDQISPPEKVPRLEGAGYTDIAGCCNGIVLLKHDLRMCLWNPATKETKILPEFKRFRDEGVAFSRSHYVGFCFDAETSDFKVILVFCPTRDRKRDFVYSLRGDCWKTVEPRSPRCFCYDGDYGIAMNSSTGMCHWFGSYLVGKRYKEAILSFDANREIFKTTIIPYSREDEYLEGDPDHGFFMLEEYVAMFREEGKRGAESYEIWAMLEVGVEKSWIKVITIGPTLPFEKVLRFWKGKIFLQTYEVSDKDGTSEEGVVIFDPFTGGISPFLMHRDMPCLQLAANYKKSQFQLREKVERRDTKKLIIKRPRTN